MPGKNKKHRGTINIINHAQTVAVVMAFVWGYFSISNA